MDLLLYEKSYLRIADRLAEVAPAVRLVVMADDGAIAVSDPRPEIAWASGDLFTGGPNRAFMIFCLKSDSIRWMQSGAAGFDHPVFGQLAAKGMTLTNSAAAAVAISEFVLASVLELFQDIAGRRAAQAAKHWDRRAVREVAGTTWLVVGLGNIGREVALRARAFGARVVGIRRSPRGDEPADAVLTPDRLVDALPEADVVVLTTATNAATERLVGSDFVAAMKPESVLVNIGRGALVDEAALLDGLDRGRPSHAVLDVFDTEPLPPESRFWSHPRVHVSAHCSAFSPGSRARGDQVFLDNLGRYLADEPLEFVVELPQSG